MRKQIKLAALAVATGLVAASAQAASYPNGDLIVGFTSASGNDFVYDLGSESSLVNLDSWDLSSYLGSFTLTSVNWGVIGDSTSSHTLYTTTDGSYTPATFTSSGLVTKLNGATQTIYNNFSASGAGNSASIDSSSSSSWNIETLNPGTGPNQYQNAYENPNAVGEVSDILYSVQNNGSDPATVGYFSLGSAGVLTFDAVPEPSTIGLLTGAGLLMVALRNKFRRNQLT